MFAKYKSTERKTDRDRERNMSNNLIFVVSVYCAAQSPIRTISYHVSVILSTSNQNAHTQTIFTG